MPQLLVKCKNCGVEFPAATQMNEEALEVITIVFPSTHDSKSESGYLVKQVCKQTCYGSHKNSKCKQ